MYFAFVFLVNLLSFVYVLSMPTQEKVDKLAACKTPFTPKVAADELHSRLITAFDRSGFKGLVNGDQFGFLYLHDGSDQLSFEDPEVEKFLDPVSTDTFQNHGVTLEKLRGPLRPPPDERVITNLIFVLPDAPNGGQAERDKTNEHEYKLLQYLTKLTHAFIRGHSDPTDPLKACPSYVLLGTVLSPCMGRGKESCTQEYVDKMKEFQKTFPSCKNTEFYLATWTEAQKLLLDNDIEILSFPGHDL